ncbi:MAG: acyltransferase [Anaerolineae bacterium]|nr:acyltransferase [Anaerolineae bacterium]
MGDYPPGFYLQAAIETPWKVHNSLIRHLVIPVARLKFALAGIPWRRGWMLYGVPILLKHRQSTIAIGDRLSLRSTLRSNPLGPNHPVILCTWREGARLIIGDDFGMTGGCIVAEQEIVIGNRVTIGANCTIMDTDFHPLDPQTRHARPYDAATAPVRIEDDVFVGMNSLILKGVTLGAGSVIGAGSVVTSDIPPGVIAAGVPAKVIRGL